MHSGARHLSLNTWAVLALILLALGRALVWWLWSYAPPRAFPYPFVLVAFADLALLTASVYAVWRCANLDRGSGLSFVLKGASAIAILISLSLLIDQWAKLAFRAPVDAPAPLELPVTGQTVILDGAITLRGFTALQETLKANPGVTTLNLTSDGGHIGAARGMVRLVIESGLSTHAVQICASACTLVFAAGAERSLAPDAQLGFHGYAIDSNVSMLSTDDEEARDAAYFQTRGITAEFAKRALAVPHSEMWFPDRATLEQAGVVTTHAPSHELELDND